MRRPYFAPFVLALLAAACSDKEPLSRDDSVTEEPSQTSSEAQGEDSGAIRFVETAALLGLDFKHSNGSRGELEIFEVMGSGVALLDYDLDGDLDVFLVQGMPIAEIGSANYQGEGDRLYRNDLEHSATGEMFQRFVDVTAESKIGGAAYGFGVAVGDANQDGWPDLYVSNFGPNKLWINQGDGTFADETERCGCGDLGMGTSVVFDDINGDSIDDIYVANYIDYNLKSPRRCTNRLGKPDFCGPAVFPGSPNPFYVGLGDGKFESRTLTGPNGVLASRSLGVVAFDLDQDRSREILVANDSDPNELWDRDPTGVFQEVADFAGVSVNGDGVAEGGMGIAVGDYDGDQDLDFLMTHLAGETSTWYAQEQPGLFLDATNTSGSGPSTFPLTGFGAVLFDAQLDGHLDLVVANGRVCGSRVPAGVALEAGMAEPNQFFVGGDHGFRESARFIGLKSVDDEVSRAVASGDLDNDGDVDFVVTNNNASVELWRNESPRPDSWVGLAFSRSQLGWSAAGQVSTADALLLSARSGSYLASSDPRVLLPCSGGGVQVTVQWHDGRTQEVDVEGCNQYHLVQYPSER